MEINWLYVVSQIFVMGNYAFLMASYQMKTRRTIVILQLLATGSNLIGYSLLGAWAGAAMCGIAVARNLYMMWDEHHFGVREDTNRRDIILLIVVYVAVVAMSALTYNGPLSLLISGAFALQTFAIWQKRPLRYKLLGIPMAVLYLLYNAYVRSLFGVILEIFVLVASVIGFVREWRQHHQRSPQ